MLCTHKTTILCQFGSFLVTLSTISQPILIHFWWELYHSDPLSVTVSEFLLSGKKQIKISLALVVNSVSFKNTNEIGEEDFSQPNLEFNCFDVQQLMECYTFPNYSFSSHLHLMVTLMYMHWVVRQMLRKDCGMPFQVETVYLVLQ